MLTSLAFLLTALALDVHAQAPGNLEPPSTSGALSALKYTSVGGSGSYKQVTNMIPGTFPSCTVNPSCIQSSKSVSGNLAPFDEDITFNFRGPMQINNIAVYQPASASASTWKLTSSFTPNKAPQNMVFMNNLGGTASGEWSICGGNSQSYAAGDWSTAAASPNAQTYSGKLPAGKEINIMTSTACTGSVCSGFSRGTANKGWDGSKMLVINFAMPTDSSSNLPAIWALNGQVVRAAEYGCNCRGVGSPGGCGELDIAEAISQNPNQLISEIYSFKGATGSGASYFPRPASGTATIVAIFDVQTDSISIVRVTSWDFTQSQIARSTVDGYLNAPAMHVTF